MKLTILLLSLLGVSSLVACSNPSSGSSDASVASANVISFVASPSTVAPGGTSVISFSGGTGSFQNAYASQGTIVQQSTTSFLYTAPTSPTSSTTTITVSDSSGYAGMGGLFITGVTTTGTTTTTVATCGGQYSVNIGGVAATLTIVQNVSGQIGGSLYFPASSVNANPYTYPIYGSCASGSFSFQNLSLSQTYSGTYTAAGAISGSVATSAGTVTFTGTAIALSATPVAESLACGGSYTANIAGNTGSLVLVHNGSGGVAGYLRLVYNSTVNLYAVTGTCGSTVSFTNNTNGSTYTGSATFNGSSVSMTGSFTTAAGQAYSWSASK